MVKFRKHAVQVVHDIIAPVIHMAGVQADAQPGAVHCVQDGPELFEPAAYLAALSGHGLQQNLHGVVRLQSLPQRCRDLGNSGLCPLAHMAAGMEIIEVPRQRRHPAQIVRQDLRRKGPGLLLGRAQVHGVGPMSNQRAEGVGFQHFQGSGRILGVFRLGAAASGVPGKEGKGIGI